MCHGDVRGVNTRRLVVARTLAGSAWGGALAARGYGFGGPVVQRAGVSTQAIAERLDAGESVTDLAVDYDLTPAEVEQAAVYERAA